MKLSARPVRTLEFPIGDKTYTVYPVGVDVGLDLTEVFTNPAKAKSRKSMDLFRSVMGPVDPGEPDGLTVWDAMRTDRVPLNDAFRAGMACLAHFQTLMQDTSPAAWDLAEQAAQAVWESGLDPEALAAFTAATSPKTQPSTQPAAATTTRRPASGSGTRTTKTAARKRASRSSGRGSSARGT